MDSLGRPWKQHSFVLAPLTNGQWQGVQGNQPCAYKLKRVLWMPVVKAGAASAGTGSVALDAVAVGPNEGGRRPWLREDWEELWI